MLPLLVLLLGFLLFLCLLVIISLSTILYNIGGLASLLVLSEEQALFLELPNDLLHDVLVLPWLGAGGQVLQPLLHLLLQALTELVGRCLAIAINS